MKINNALEYFIGRALMGYGLGVGRKSDFGGRRSSYVNYEIVRTNGPVEIRTLVTVNDILDLHFYDNMVYEPQWFRFDTDNDGPPFVTVGVPRFNPDLVPSSVNMP